MYIKSVTVCNFKSYKDSISYICFAPSRLSLWPQRAPVFAGRPADVHASCAPHGPGVAPTVHQAAAQLRHHDGERHVRVLQPAI